MSRLFNPEVENAIQRHAGEIDQFARRHYGLTGSQLLHGLVQVESGGNQGAVSNKNARSITQFIPSTRDAVIRRYGIDPWKNADSAVESAILHLKGQVTGQRGLRGYNPGDPNYPHQVLSAARGFGGGGGGSQGGTRTATVEVGGKTSIDLNAMLLDHLRTRKHESLAKTVLRGLESGDYVKQEPDRQVSVQLPSGAPPEGQGGSHYTVSPNANREGHAIKPYVLGFANAIGARVGGIEIGTGTRHNQFVAGTARQSDHWTGQAVDLPVPRASARGDRVAAAALMEAGVPKAQAVRMARKGGVFNVVRNGFRIQVIWKTYTGGDHFTHVHVGVRPV